MLLNYNKFLSETNIFDQNYQNNKYFIFARVLEDLQEHFYFSPQSSSNPSPPSSIIQEWKNRNHNWKHQQTVKYRRDEKSFVEDIEKKLKLSVETSGIDNFPQIWNVLKDQLKHDCNTLTKQINQIKEVIL